MRDPTRQASGPISESEARRFARRPGRRVLLLLLSLLRSAQHRKAAIDVLQRGLELLLLVAEQLPQRLAVLVAQRGTLGKFDETHNDTPPVEIYRPNQKRRNNLARQARNNQDA